MRFRAIVFDVYKTILEVGPAPTDRDEKWQTLARSRFGAAPQLNLAEFATACDRVIAREHAAARAAGILHPEIFWPEIVAEVIPEIRTLPVSEQTEMLYRQQTLFRTVSLMAGAGEVLRSLRDSGALIGIASNAQPYTLREVKQALAGEGLSLEVFRPALCFWSFEHGFSKPDPHVFRLLTARLHLAGVNPGEALMVGDRFDNDIAPARAQRWNTWQLTSIAQGKNGGDWRELGEFLAAD